MCICKWCCNPWNSIEKRNIAPDGDIISVDLVAYKNGFNGDCCRTYFVGNVSEEAKRLTEVTKQSFYEGIKFAKKGFRLGDICHAIGEYVEKNGYSVVREFQGHGIGESMHEDPGIPNYGKAGRGIRLEPGMTLAIEPMVIMGKHFRVRWWLDYNNRGWKPCGSLWKYNFNYRKWARNIDIIIKMLYTI